MGRRSPFVQHLKYPNIQYKTATLAISHGRGFLGYYMPREGAVTGITFTNFVRRLVYIYGGQERMRRLPCERRNTENERPLFALLLDNASIHRG